MNPEGAILAAIIGGAAAIATLVVVKLRPRWGDPQQSPSAKLLRRWRRFAGLDE